MNEKLRRYLRLKEHNVDDLEGRLRWLRGQNYNIHLLEKLLQTFIDEQPSPSRPRERIQESVDFLRARLRTAMRLRHEFARMLGLGDRYPPPPDA